MVSHSTDSSRASVATEDGDSLIGQARPDAMLGGQAVTWSQLRTYLCRRLRGAGLEDADWIARPLVCAWLGLEDETALWVQDAITPPEGAQGWHRLSGWVNRLEAGESLPRILGEREFWSLPFLLGPDVLEPRPDSELLVEVALSCLASVTEPRILDLGTGSGAILLAILREVSDASGLGIDRSESALNVARTNAVRLGLAERATFMLADWREPVVDLGTPSGDAVGAPGVGGGLFDLIVCNPPYVTDAEWEALPARIKDYEPVGALRAGADGLDAYRALSRYFRTAERLLAPDGPPAQVLFEIGIDQEDDVIELMVAARLVHRLTRRDLAGTPRVLGFVRA